MTNAAALRGAVCGALRLALVGLLAAASGCQDDAPATDAGPVADVGPETCEPGLTQAVGLTFPGPDPGAADVQVIAGQLELSNQALAVVFGLQQQRLSLVKIEDRINHGTLEPQGELFVVRTLTGRTLRSSQLEVDGQPQVEDLAPECQSVKLGPRFAGKRITVQLKDPAGELAIQWQAELRDAASYVRQSVRLAAVDQPVPLTQLVLFDLHQPAAKTVGTVTGSPVVAGNVFFGYEHPMAQNAAGQVYTQVGRWEPSQMSYPDHTQIEWDVTAAMEGQGAYWALFNYTGGAHRLDIYWAALLQDGKEVYRDTHEGYTGTLKSKNTYRLELPSYDPAASYTLRAEVRSDQGTDSSGTVSVAYLEGGPRIHCSLAQQGELTAHSPLTHSAVVGVTPAGQLRRGFLYYLERERTHPYRPFLHYNSWYDIGYFSTYDEQDALGIIQAFGTELHDKRGVTLDSFLFDDGWDDPQTLWGFHSGFPQGFKPLAQAAAGFGTAPGIWLSPWGGYGKPKEARLAYGKSQGYETNDKGFVLSGPKYYARFREICLDLVQNHGINQFKLDGIGRNSDKYPGSAFNSDFEAAMALMGDLRRVKPELYVNLTTGTWASPFWLLYADSIWRGGYDHEFTGVGSDRQRWLTYRDSKTYQNVVQGGPLFPLSSLMLHGVIYAKQARQLDSDPGGDLRQEIRTAFGCGTQLQELYVSPGLMSQQNWDDLAQSAKWARDNARTLQDTHWVGGDPAKLEVYGWASWSPEAAILVLRNPSDAAASLSVDAGAVFELPAGAATRYDLGTPYADQRLKSVTLEAGKPQELTLEPFEVLVFHGS